MSFFCFIRHSLKFCRFVSHFRALLFLEEHSSTKLFLYSWLWRDEEDGLLISTTRHYQARRFPGRVSRVTTRERRLRVADQKQTEPGPCMTRFLYHEFTWSSHGEHDYAALHNFASGADLAAYVPAAGFAKHISIRTQWHRRRPLPPGPLWSATAVYKL